jgi:hypothetical protein
MASTYTTELRIEQMVTGEKSGTWGTITNLQLANIEAAIAGTVTVAFASDGNDTLTTANGADDEARHMVLDLSGGSTLTATRDMVVPDLSKLYLVKNATTGSQSVQIIGTGTGITVPNGKRMFLYNDGTNVLDAITHMNTVTLGTALAETSGGTGQSTWTAGDIVYSDSANSLAKLAKGTDDQVLTLASGLPSWATSSAVADVKFLVTPSGAQSNLTGDGTTVTVAWGTEVHDTGNDFATNTFTAPSTGKYHFSAQVRMTGIVSGHTIAKIDLVTSNRTYRGTDIGTVFAGFGGVCLVQISIDADMDASDTATIAVTVENGAKVVDIPLSLIHI